MQEVILLKTATVPQTTHAYFTVLYVGVGLVEPW